jgi:ABC-2 type transport system permease protein
LSLRRLGLVAGLDLQESCRRPLFWIWSALMVWNAWLMARGIWFYRSVDTSLGSPTAWVTSEFQIAYVVALLGFLIFAYFVAVAAGVPLLRDEELKVGEILHATPLAPGEYVWGKFLAALASCLGVVAVLMGAAALLGHVFPDPANPGFYGPFAARNYLVPALVFLLPGIVFTAGAAFALGRVSGRPIVVFLLPIVLFLFLDIFVWRWFPLDLAPWLNRLLMYLDPSGFRWLKDTWLRTDRGIVFYNTRPIGYDAPFLASRAGLALAGLALVDLARRHFAGGLRQPARSRSRPWRRAARAVQPAAGTAAAGATSAPLAALGMRTRLASAWSATWTVARFELTELASQPGLYVFIPAILLFLVIDLDANSGEFQAPVLLTSGTAAVAALLDLTLWLCPLLLFYTVESLQREESTGMAPVYYATPAPTGAIVAGKALANGGVVLAALAAALATSWLIMRGQGAVGFDLWPFALIWGLLLLPTLALWIAFVAAAFALTRSRYATYGIGLAALLVTAYFYTRNEMNWAGNWPLVNAVRWSDMGTFELDRRALLLNRLLALALAAVFAYLAVRLFARRDRDRLHPLLGRRPGARRRFALATSALAVAPLALGLGLWGLVDQGFQGGAIEKKHKDYWRKNLATWIAAPLPYVTRVELDVDLDPARRGFAVRGFYDLENQKPRDLPWFPVTGGTAWRGLAWTLDGRPWRPEERAGLHVFRLPAPLHPGGRVRLGFRYAGTLLPGVSKNGGAVPLAEFLLPSGVLVTGRNPDFVPVVGYDKRIGVDEKNRYEPQLYPPDFYLGVTDSDLDRSAFTERLRITAPAEYTINSTGVEVSDAVRGGRRTAVWESDYPVRVFNIAAGRWAVRRGHGTAVHYHPGHPYNVDSMLAALDGARRWYAEWFGPYPWRELRLNEFPNLDNYARGNATNIFFSEGTGFLYQRTPKSDLPFAVTAHEAAHQWWGHIVAPGEGPGGILLAEGAANFSTLLLLEQLRGLPARREFAVQIEADYGENRQVSDEKPLVETLNYRPADNTVIYNKGGWVFWMLMRRMGRPAFFAGVRQYFRVYHGNPDHPVLQDFVAVMRPYAPDRPAFDDFVRQWLYQVVAPEYALLDSRKERVGEGWEAVVRLKNAGTGRMPVEVAATNGDRFAGDGRLLPNYRDARATVALGAGEAREVRIRCPFEPRQVVVDPDANVLQLQRRAATARL